MTVQIPKRPAKKIPLRLVLIGLFVLHILLAVGVVGYLSARNGQKAVNNVAHQLRGEIMARIQQHLANFLDTPHLINQINARLIRQGVLNVNDSAALERYFWQQVQVYDSVTSIYFGNIKGGLVNAGREGADGSLYVINTDGFASGPFRKYATDREGNQTNLLLTVPDFDARVRPWYSGAVETAAAMWSDPYILFTGQDMAIAASRPVYDGQGDLLGVASIDIFVSHISDFLQELEIGSTGQCFIVERSGLLVASSTHEDPFTDLEAAGGQRRLHATESQIPLISRTAEFLTDQFGDYGAVHQEQQLEFSIDGQRHFLQLSPIRDEYGIDWLAVIVIPESDFMAQINANNRITALLIVLAVMVAIIIGIVAAQWVTRPVSRLNTATQAIAKGDWGQLAAPEWIAEIDELTFSLNHMAEQLKQTLESLQLEIAERRRAQEQLEKEREFTETALNAQRDTFFVFDPSTGKAVRWNQAFKQVAGYSDQEIGEMKAPDSWYSSEDLSKAAEAVNKALQEGHARVELSLITKSGKTIPTEYSAAAILDEAGQPEFVIAIGRDITERKQDEAALQESNRRLEEALVELQEMQQQMVQQERLAAVGQLAAGIAHDFNNILASIVLYAQMSMRFEDLPAKLHERMTIIDQQAKHATKLIQQILDFSRRTMLERRPLDLCDLLKEQISLLERTLPDDVEISFSCVEDGDPAKYRVDADPTRLKQIVTNLAVNARDAMPDGGELRISLEQIRIDSADALPLSEMEVGEWVRMTVTDTGEGISAEVLPHIFEPFFTTKAPLGSGLGLSQVHGIVAQHNGRIDVQSQMGQGTTVTIYLKALPLSETVDSAPKPDLPELPLGQQQRILLVEDEEIVRLVLAETLVSLDYQVIEAENGEKALDICQEQNDIALVLTDVVMPGMGGVALYHHLRQQSPGVPVILMSGNPTDSKLVSLSDQGSVKWLLKPPDLEQLARMLAEVISAA